MKIKCRSFSKIEGQALKSNEVVVFETNGTHRQQFIELGAVSGDIFGHRKQTFAIPVAEDNGQLYPLNRVGLYIKALILYAQNNPHLHFVIPPTFNQISKHDYRSLFVDVAKMENFTVCDDFIQYFRKC